MPSERRTIRDAGASIFAVFLMEMLFEMVPLEYSRKPPFSFPFHLDNEPKLNVYFQILFHHNSTSTSYPFIRLVIRITFSPGAFFSHYQTGNLTESAFSSLCQVRDTRLEEIQHDNLSFNYS